MKGAEHEIAGCTIHNVFIF